MNIFVQLDAWLSALVFAALMLIGWGVGAQIRRWNIAKGGSPSRSSRIEDGGLALFGLLLAFCFSGAVGRYDARKELLLNDAMAIGDLAIISSTLEEPDRSALHNEIQTYVKQRLTFGTMQLDDPRMPHILKDGQSSHARMLATIQHVIANKNTASLHTPLMNAYIELIGAYEKRYYGVQKQVNGNILLMMVLFGMFSTFTMGRLHDPKDDGRYGLLRACGYVFLVSLVYFITVDMEQPRRGLMLVSQAPMQDLLTSLQGNAQ